MNRRYIMWMMWLFRLNSHITSMCVCPATNDEYELIQYLSLCASLKLWIEIWCRHLFYSHPPFHRIKILLWMPVLSIFIHHHFELFRINFFFFLSFSFCLLNGNAWGVRAYYVIRFIDFSNDNISNHQFIFCLKHLNIFRIFCSLAFTKTNHFIINWHLNINNMKNMFFAF